MIRIGICDDEPIMLDKIKRLVLLAVENKEEEVFIDTYLSPHEFIIEVFEKEKQYNIFLLDIDMPEVSGFDLANKLMEADYKGLVIFITSHNEYVFDAFRYQPFRYIRKSVMETELKEAIKTGLTNLSKNTKYFYCKTEDGNVRMDYDDILYFELVNRKINFYGKDNSKYTTWATIASLMEIFGEYGFVQIHSGAVVNVKYIRSFSKKDVTLDNGERLPISRGRSKEVAMELSRYWGEKV